MATELTLESLTGGMTAADFVKAFKDKSAWKKAKYVLILADFKLDGKKMTVALPFRKPNEAKDAFKKIKKEKIHLLKKVGIGSFELGTGENGPQANIELTLGGLSADIAQLKAEKLFGRLKLALHLATGTTVPAEQEEKEEEEEDDDDDVKNDNVSDNSKKTETTAKTTPTMTKEEADAKLDSVKKTLQNIAGELGIALNI